MPRPEENRRAIKGDRAGPCCFAKERYGFDDWSDRAVPWKSTPSESHLPTPRDVIASCVIHPGEECTQVKSGLSGGPGSIVAAHADTKATRTRAFKSS
jgi:hypothetical protein